MKYDIENLKKDIQLIGESIINEFGNLENFKNHKNEKIKVYHEVYISTMELALSTYSFYENSPTYEVILLYLGVREQLLLICNIISVKPPI